VKQVFTDWTPFPSPGQKRHSTDKKTSTVSL